MNYMYNFVIIDKNCPKPSARSASGFEPTPTRSSARRPMLNYSSHRHLEVNFAQIRGARATMGWQIHVWIINKFGWKIQVLVRSTYKMIRRACSIHEKVRLVFTVDFERKTMKGNVQGRGLGAAMVWAMKRRRTLAITLTWNRILNWWIRGTLALQQYLYVSPGTSELIMLQVLT